MVCGAPATGKESPRDGNPTSSLIACMTSYEAATSELRSRSTGGLISGLTAYMRACEPIDDWRDVLVGFAPFYDCALRLEFDPTMIFDTAADSVGGEAGDLARVFGRRSDVTPSSWGYVIEEGPDGPAYRPALSAGSWVGERATSSLR
jgi:hypothetical protein